MEFGKQLDEYMTLLDCSNRELSEITGISVVSVWRYRNGSRTPKSGSKELEGIAKGLARIAKEREAELSEKMILDSLSETVFSPQETQALIKKLRVIMQELKMPVKELAGAMMYDASFLSKVLRGKIEPSNPDTHIAPLAAYLSSDNIDKNKKLILCRIIGCDIETASDQEKLYNRVYDYLSTDAPLSSHAPATVDSFVKKLDEFNLEDYISKIHFDDITVPTAPIKLPRSRYYHGIEEMKESEIDFVRSTVLSRSKEPVFSYSDMPLKEMSEDEGFTKKYMIGLAMMIKKGLHLNIIHDVSRPFEEMMIGLEGFIPLYMTGQISPYYLKESSGELMNLLLKVSGAAALHGEAVCGFHEMGRYYFSTKKEDVDYYKLQSELLLRKALPLMDIYTAERSREFLKSYYGSFSVRGERKMFFGCLPSAAVPDELLDGMLSGGSADEKDCAAVRGFVKRSRELFEELLERENVTVVLPKISESALKEDAPALSFPTVFRDLGIRYTPEGYRAHFEAAKELFMRYPKCRLEISDSIGLKNIDITVISGKQVIVSKAKSPMIHFVINHPRMVAAFDKFTVPIDGAK